MARRYTVPNQMASVRQDPSLLRSFDCGIHSMTYQAVDPGCPLCLAERDLDETRKALLEARNRLELVIDENHRLKLANDLIYAIREASYLLNDDDLSFIKVALYQFRDEKSLSMKITYGKAKKDGSRTPNGFIVLPRKGDPYGHLCSSYGGLAIAEYFGEATNSYGSGAAMSYLARGMAPHLPGGLQ